MDSGFKINSNLGAVSKGSTPFYVPPPRKTSVDIINEAKLAIRGKFC